MREHKLRHLSEIKIECNGGTGGWDILIRGMDKDFGFVEIKEHCHRLQGVETLIRELRIQTNE